MCIIHWYVRSVLVRHIQGIKPINLGASYSGNHPHSRLGAFLRHLVGISKAFRILRVTIHSTSLVFEALRFHSSKVYSLYQLRVSTPQEFSSFGIRATLSLVFTSIIHHSHLSIFYKKKVLLFMFYKSAGSFWSMCSTFLSSESKI